MYCLSINIANLAFDYPERVESMTMSMTMLLMSTHSRIFSQNFDTELTYNKHIQNTQFATCTYHISVKHKFMEQQTEKKHTYKAIRRPRHVYVFTSWALQASDTNVQIVQVMQNAALR